MSELSTETDTTQDGRIILSIPWADYIREHGYAVDGISDVRTVDSDSRELTHVVARIQTYEYPRGHEQLDITTHSAEIPVCSCESFTYNEGADVSESMVKPTQAGRCKHLTEAYREERAKADDKQRSLTDE